MYRHLQYVQSNWRLYTGTKLFLSGKITVRAKNSLNPCKVVLFLTGHGYRDAVHTHKFLVSPILFCLQTKIPEVPGQEATCEHE